MILLLLPFFFLSGECHRRLGAKLAQYSADLDAEEWMEHVTQMPRGPRSRIAPRYARARVAFVINRLGSDRRLSAGARGVIKKRIDKAEKGKGQVDDLHKVGPPPGTQVPDPPTMPAGC